MSLEAALCCNCFCSVTPASCQYASSYYAQPLQARVEYSLSVDNGCTGFQCYDEYAFECELTSSSPIIAQRISAGGTIGCFYRAQFNMRAKGSFTFRSVVIGTGTGPNNPGNNGTQETFISFNRTVEGCLTLRPTCNPGCFCSAVGNVPNVLKWTRRLSVCNFRMGVSNGVSDYDCLETGFEDLEPDAWVLHNAGGAMNQAAPWGDPRTLEFQNCSMLQHPDADFNACWCQNCTDYYSNVESPWGIVRKGQGDPEIPDCANASTGIASIPLVAPAALGAPTVFHPTQSVTGSLQCGNYQGVAICKDGREGFVRTFSAWMDGGRFT